VTWRRWILGAATLLAVAAPVAVMGPQPAQAFRVGTWNLLAFDDAAFAARRSQMLQVLPGLNPDVMIVQELLTSTAADSFANLLKATHPEKTWVGGSSTFILGTQSALFYDAQQFTHSNLASISDGGPRQVLVALVRPNGYKANAASFRIYSIHLKAGKGDTTPTDSSTRTTECTNLRNTLNLAPGGTNLLVGGDTNFYGSYETGYTRFTESEPDNDGRLKDNLPLSGVWNNPSFAPYHTQSPCGEPTPCVPNGSIGGMDDRFDMLLGSYSLNDGAGLDLVAGGLPGGYGAYGNDGLHYNTSIDAGGFNNAVGLAVATALKNSSDHIPVIATLQLPQKLACADQMNFPEIITGGTGNLNLFVHDVPPPPAATLQYSLAAPAGFTAPAGTFTNPAGPAPNVHVIGFNATSVGDHAGTLFVNSNDLDTTAKAVLLSGRVLAHSVPSFDSVTVAVSRPLDFGTVAVGSHSELSLRWYNLGFSPFQARIQRQAEFVAGDTRFAVSGAPGFVSDAATDAVTFDATGATPDADYTAELRIATADEPLPGALANDTLRVSLHAKIAANGGVDGLPASLRFAPPAPNPLQRATTFAFDLPHDAPASLAIYDAGGRRVAVLAEGAHAAGRYTVRWQAAAADGSALRAGLYFARFTTPGLTRVARIVVLP